MLLVRFAGRGCISTAPNCCFSQKRQRYECIGDIRGRGLLIGLEIVKDRESRTPDRPLAAQVQKHCLDLGLVLHSVRSDWESAVRIAPPLTVTQDELDSGLAIMEQAFAESLAAGS